MHHSIGYGSSSRFRAARVRNDGWQPAHPHEKLERTLDRCQQCSHDSIAQKKTVVRADTKKNFEAVVAAIHKEMEPGGRWQYLDSGERSTIDNNFADMQKLYDQFGSVDNMDDTAKSHLVADQNRINAILANNDSNRLICEYHSRVGTHFPVKTCKTYAQMRAEENNAQEFMRIRNAKGTAATQAQSLSGGHGR